MISLKRANIIFKEVRKENGLPFQRLKEQARRQKYSLLKVIRIWGDPRKW